MDEVLDGRVPEVFALGEAMHGVAAFPLLRNEVLAHLVERGFRSIALEIDYFAAGVVDEYVNGVGYLENVLAEGFSHGFGRVPGNRELVEWLRAYNARAEERVRFYGFDAPIEYAGAASPRRTLVAVVEGLGGDASDINALVGVDEEWTNPAAMYDPAASIGASARAEELRGHPDDLARRVRTPELAAHARTARGLLRYHAAMASGEPDRIGRLVAVRAEMMADNLRAIAARERGRGPCLVHAHNRHLHPRSGAGALVAGEVPYLFVATDGGPGAPGTLQGELAAATEGRGLFPGDALRAALPKDVPVGEPVVRGHLPLTRDDLDGTDAVVFVAEPGEQHRYW
ncbi:hypothetical protein GCM10023148_01000 [Actinokineospora soli]